MLTRQSLKSRLLAYVAAAGLSLCGANPSLAGDCGCAECARAQACPTCFDCSGRVPGANYCTSKAGCNCLICKHGKGNYLFKALDGFAGGVEKLLQLDKCGCQQGCCDDGCDGALARELSAPLPPADYHKHHHHPTPHAAPVHDSNVHKAPAVQPYSGPTRDIKIAPTGPTQFGGGQPMRMSQPQLEPSFEANQHLGGQHLGGAPVAVPPPVRLPSDERPRIPEVDPTSDRESLFDTMSDPFRDDQTRVRAYQSVRPARYMQDDLRPIRRRPLR